MAEFYGELAHDYEWLFPDAVTGSGGMVGATSPGSQDILEGLLEALPRGARVLDCACGIGADAIALARSGYNVTASDGSASMVAEARRRSRRSGVEMKISQSRWQELSERVPGPFDLILCLGNAMVHAEAKPNMISALKNIRRVLSPGGILVVDSRNWELLYESRPRIIISDRVIHAIQARGPRGRHENSRAHRNRQLLPGGQPVLHDRRGDAIAGSRAVRS
jgi:glycine/sarcosine N-methyltransferase